MVLWIDITETPLQHEVNYLGPIAHGAHAEYGPYDLEIYRSTMNFRRYVIDRETQKHLYVDAHMACTPSKFTPDWNRLLRELAIRWEQEQEWTLPSSQ